MRLEKFFSRKRILDLEGDSTEECLKQLLKSCSSSFKDLSRKKLLPGLMQRESTMTTYLGNGVALPHLRVKMNRRFVFAIGRHRKGLSYDGTKDDEKVHIIILLLAGDKARGYLQVLAAVARLVKDESLMRALVEADDLNMLHSRLTEGFSGIAAKPERGKSTVNRMIFSQALTIAKGAKCASIAVFSDTSIGSVPLPKSYDDFKTVFVTRRAKDTELDVGFKHEVIQVRSFSKGRLSQLRSAVLLGITRGIFEPDERVCCIGGIPESNQFDTIVVVDLKQEFSTLHSANHDFMPPGLEVEVLERVIGIAMELSVEGREGKSVGCLFVLGDSKKVESMAKPLVLNPFYGYKDEDCNILSPFMDETIKEFSSIDGAFIVRGDGVIQSAGSLIHAPDFDHELPGGLGARHAAAAAISLATQCVSIVLSSSTGQVTIFRKGTALSLMEKPFTGYSQ